MKSCRFSLPVEIKLASDGLSAGEVVGYASTYDVDQQGDQVMPGAFRTTLAAHKAKSTQPLMLWNHDLDVPLGKWETLREDSRGLYVRGKLSLGVAKADDARILARDGILGLSIGYVTIQSAYVGRTRQLKAVDLYEVSLTPLPANVGAKIMGAKSSRPDTTRALENALHDLGFSIRESKLMAPVALAAINRNDPSIELASLIEAAAQTFSLSKEKV
jgi:HK97 family phage prohead protease